MVKAFIEKYLGSIIRHGLTTLAGVLVTLGVIQAGASDAFVNVNAEVLAGIIFYILGQGTSFIKNAKS